jgi:hypothetical protein
MNKNALPSSLPPPVGEVVYVRIGGSSLGDGTLSRPFGTIQQALTSISDNSSSKVYHIDVGPGSFADAFQIKPFVAIVGVDSGSAFYGQTQVTAAANSCGFDSSWSTAGFAYAWMAALVFVNGQTYAEPSGSQPQLNYRNCTFQGTMVYTGPGTTGTDNILWEGCLAYGGVTVQGWQFFWTRHTEILGGSVLIQAAPSSGALESTTWLSQDCAIGRSAAPTSVTIRWAAPTPTGFISTADFGNSSIIGSLTIDGAHASFFGTPEAMPETLTLVNGGTVAHISFNYSPAVLANWGDSAPYSLPNALDILAARTSASPPVPTGTQTNIIANVTCTGTGNAITSVFHVTPSSANTLITASAEGRMTSGVTNVYLRLLVDPAGGANPLATGTTVGKIKVSGVTDSGLSGNTEGAASFSVLLNSTTVPGYTIGTAMTMVLSFDVTPTTVDTITTFNDNPGGIVAVTGLS